ncbi:hypothetical protein NLJ89_g10892 [Agrocybe chaxingu]|uniref:F-box domain-containing protein n=1 Tax=Agrocybe chaxingu TaxID=84603 RepID=A0A9W8JPR6_9AGAR|nr:hypothetical protein NLJ89_g10892 [Agrocybe chaxingu]
MLCDLCQAGRSDIPRDSACEVVDGEPCDPCLKITDLDIQISNVEVILKRLTDTRRILQTARNHIHDPIVNHLPPELIQRIFSLYAHSDDDDTSAYIQKEKFVPLVLGAICKTWREIAWNTPDLWTRLSFSVDSNIKKNMVREREMSFQWLSRTGDLPLSLYMDRARWESSSPQRSQMARSWVGFIQDLMNEFGNRFRVLDVELPVKIFFPVMSKARLSSQLKRLAIRINYCDSALEVFSLSTDTLEPEYVSLSRIEPRLVKISWNNVTELALHEYTGDACSDIFVYAPSLVSCQLRSIQPDSNQQLQSITHLQLRHLIIKSPADNFLKRATFPELKTLSMEYAAVSTMRDFVSRSCCNLKTLEVTLRFYKETANSLFELLQEPYLHSLKSLNINLRGLANRERIFSAFPEKPAFLPVLQSITYNCWDQGLQFAWVLPLMLSTKFRPLSTIKIKHPDDIYEDENLRHFFEFRRCNPDITLEFLDLDPDFIQKQAKRLGLE